MTPDSPRFRLSRQQERTWFVDQITALPVGYQISMVLRLTGPLDVGALHSALTEIVTRHEVLRTSVDTATDELVGVLRPPSAFTLPQDDLARDPRYLAGGLDAVLRGEIDAPLDLVDGLPIRARLLREGAQDHLLCLTLHHMAFDDWSCGVLFAELEALYAAFADGAPPPLPPLPMQYREAAAQQDEWLDADEQAGQLAYWREKLDGLVPLEFPTDLPRPPRRNGRGSTLSAFTLSGATAAGLAELGRRLRATTVMVLIAACHAVLYRHTQSADVTVGTTTNLRRLPEADQLIGLFVNMLPLRGDLSGNPTFAELVERTRDLALDAYDNSDVSFDQVVEMIAPERDLSRTPLFQVLLNFDMARHQLPRLPGLSVADLPIAGVTSKYDLVIGFRGDDKGLHGEIAWDTELYEADTIRQLGDHLRVLLDHAAAQPDTPLDELDLLTPAQRRELRDLTSQAAVDVPARSLHELFEEQAARSPTADAVVDDNESVTYAELDSRANRIARALREHGVGPDVAVGIMLDRSVDLIAALLGVLKAGGAYLPIEVDTPASRATQLLADSRAPVCLARPDLADRVAAAGCVPLTTVACLADDRADPDDRADRPDSAPLARVSPANLCSIYYTSGSTGRPKGVANTHAGWVNRMWWMQRRHGLAVGETVLQKTTLTFDDSAVEIFWPLLVGGRVAMLAAGAQGDPWEIIEAAIRHRAVHVQFVPSVLDLFLDALTDDDVRGLHLLRSVLSSGEALHGALVERFLARFGDRVSLDNTWGITEVSIDSTFHTCTAADAAGGGVVSLGCPMDNNEVYVLDRNLEPLPVGVSGELCIGGVGLARGYLGDPARTAEAFVPHPWRHGQRLYRTGDRGRLRRDGSFEFDGRADHQVKIRGVRIELGEVDAVLRRSPDVADAAVTTKEGSSGDKRLVAYVTLAPGSTATVPELRKFLQSELPSYSVPSMLGILDAIPRMPSGKLDRRALPVAVEGSSTADTAPVTIAEQVLAGIWSGVLGLDSIGMHDNFFAVGGHSLLVVRAVNRMREAFSLVIPLSLVFECPTVASAAGRVEALVLADIQALSDDEVEARLTDGRRR